MAKWQMKKYEETSHFRNSSIINLMSEELWKWVRTILLTRIKNLLCKIKIFLCKYYKNDYLNFEELFEEVKPCQQKLRSAKICVFGDRFVKFVRLYWPPAWFVLVLFYTVFNLWRMFRHRNKVVVDPPMFLTTVSCAHNERFQSFDLWLF